jgi:hypothetical protein
MAALELRNSRGLTLHISSHIIEETLDLLREEMSHLWVSACRVGDLWWVGTSEG